MLATQEVLVLMLDPVVLIAENLATFSNGCTFSVRYGISRSSVTTVVTKKATAALSCESFN